MIGTAINSMTVCNHVIPFAWSIYHRNKWKNSGWRAQDIASVILIDGPRLASGLKRNTLIGSESETLPRIEQSAQKSQSLRVGRRGLLVLPAGSPTRSGAKDLMRRPKLGGIKTQSGKRQPTSPGRQGTRVPSRRTSYPGAVANGALEARCRLLTSPAFASFNAATALGASSPSVKPRRMWTTTNRSCWAAQVTHQTFVSCTESAIGQRASKTPYNTGCNTACSAGDVALPIWSATNGC